MTMQSLTGTIYYPSFPTKVTTSPSYTTVDVFATGGMKYFAVFQAPRTCNLRTVRFRLGTVTTGDTVDVRAETVSLSGNHLTPTGTLIDTNTNASLVIDNADDNKMVTATLTADAPLVAGSFYSVGFVIPGSTTANFGVSTFADGASGFPYNMIYNETPAWVAYNQQPCVSLLDSSGVAIAYGGNPLANLTNQNIDNAGTLQYELGNRMTLPYKATLCGIKIWADLDAAVRLCLYVGGSLVRYVDVPEGGRGTTNSDLHEYRFTKDGNGDAAQEYTIDANTPFDITCINNNNTDVAITYATFAATADMGAIDGGSNIYRIYRKSGEGTFTKDTATRIFISAIICGLDDGASAGGGGGGWFAGE